MLSELKKLEKELEKDLKEREGLSKEGMDQYLDNRDMKETFS